MNFSELLDEVARRTFLSKEMVRKVIDTARDVIIERLSVWETVRLVGFGVFKIRKHGKRKHGFGVKFDMAKEFEAQLLKGLQQMEKYGVQTNPDKTKTASEKPTCPECGSELVAGSNVPMCPKHGTAPFEKKGQP